MVGSKIYFIAGTMNSQGPDYFASVNVDGSNLSEITLQYNSSNLIGVSDIRADGNFIYFHAKTSNSDLYTKMFKFDTTDSTRTVSLVYAPTQVDQQLYSWTVDSGVVYGLVTTTPVTVGNVTTRTIDLYRVSSTTTISLEATTGLSGTQTCVGGLHPSCTSTGSWNSYPISLVHVGSTWVFDVSDSSSQATSLYSLAGGVLSTLSLGISGSDPVGIQVVGSRLFIGYQSQNFMNPSADSFGVAEVAISNGALSIVSRNSGVSAWSFMVSSTTIPTIAGAPVAPVVVTRDARPTPQLDLSGLSVIPAPAVGATAGIAGIDLKGKNLPTVASVTVAGQSGKVVTSTETALKLELPTLAPGSYDIVMKTEGNGSITIQNGLVIAAPAPKVDPTPIPPVVITPSIPRTTLVAASTPVPGFLPGKAGVSEAQKAIIQDVVLTKNVTSLECVGVTNAKVSAKLASARAASICAAAKAQNADLTTSVKTIAEAKVNGPIGSVLINYNH